MGICVACKRPICIECSTPVEGIHRCVDCFGRMGAAVASEGWTGRESHPALLFLSLAGTALAYGLFHLAALAFAP